MSFDTTIPARLDALPWSRWHWRVVTALGVTWMLDGLEVTVVGSLGPALSRGETLGLGETQVGWSGSAYVAGAVLGSLYFGRLADRLGRKRLFLVTLGVYAAATLMTALSFDFASFAFCRLVTGFGIGGEYAAINSAIDELIPARVRGAVALAINGSFWVGAAAGAGLSLVLLHPGAIPPAYGWRLAFALGALLGIGILLVRRHLPESPRWLLIRGHADNAEQVVSAIEAEVAASTGVATAPPSRTLTLRVRDPLTWGEIARLISRRYARRSLLGFCLMAAQAFFYNAIFFTYALVLSRFYGVPDAEVGLHILPFAAGNFLGPLLLGWMFDAYGRRLMIAATYGISALALVATGWAFTQGALSAAAQTACWSGIFFFASAAASSAYLTVSEVFPLEMRAVAISVFYSVGTGIGGFVGPALFGTLIGTHDREAVYAGYLAAAALMLGAAAVAARLGVDAERRSLEEIARPLSAE